MDSHPASNASVRPAGAHRPATVGMLCAVAYVVMLIGQLIPPVMFLSYDPKDVIIVISGFIFGPLTAVLITVLVDLVEMVTVSSTGVYGFIMNTVQTCSFVVPAVLIYQRWRTSKGAIGGLAAAVVSMTAMMCLWNYIITPFYMGQPREAVAAMLPTLFLPFNLVKGTINAGLTLLLYKPMVTALRRANLVEPSAGSGGTGGLNWGMVLLGAVLTLTGVLLILVMLGVI